jgi:putative salt-induced outer membrane protein YdiY
MKLHRQIIRAARQGLLAAILATTLNTLVSAQDAAPAPIEEPVKPKWERSASLGLTVTQGNADTVLLTSNILGLRKWDKNEVRLSADGTYGQNQSTTINESIRGSAQYNRILFNDRAFFYGRADALHDGIADVEYRLTLGPGAGYYFIKSDKTTLSAEAGPSFVTEKQGDIDNQYAALRLAERFAHKLTDRARVWQSAEVMPQVDDWDNFLIVGEVGIEADLTEKLALRAFIQDTYDNAPALGRNKNDLKLVTAIGYKF